MMAAEFYKKTLAGYEASLSKGDSVSLSRYCKIHHVNCRGLRYWMKKHSINTPKGKSGRVATHSISNNTDQAGNRASPDGAITDPGTHPGESKRVNPEQIVFEER